MPDGNDNFVAPLPPEDVYGLGIAGPPSKTDHTENVVESGTEENRVSQINNEVKEAPESSPSEGSETQNQSLEEHLGNNIDTTA